jgi:hypothetical protein
MTTLPDVESKILQVLITSANADNLRNEMFGSGKLLDQYLQLPNTNIDEFTKIFDKVLQRLQDLRFDEFKDEELVNWRRIRTSVEHENILINHRLSWLFSSQAFLFTTFILVFNAWKANPGGQAAGSHFPYLLSIISVVGIFICVSIQRSLNSAEEQLRDLDKWWHREWDNQSGDYRVWTDRKSRVSALKQKSLKHPPLQGFIRHAWWDRWFTYSIIPALFLVAWALIIALIILDLSSPVVNFMNERGLLVISYVGVAVAALAIKEAISRGKANP